MSGQQDTSDESWTDDDLLDEWAWVRDDCLNADFPRRARVTVGRWTDIRKQAADAGDPRAAYGRADRVRSDYLYSTCRGRNRGAA